MSPVEYRRSNARHRRRIRVALGGQPVFTSDVSAGGFCAELTRVLPPGSKVTGIVTLGIKDYPFAGQVMWSKPGDARIGIRGRMGIQFQEVAPGFAEELARTYPSR